MTRLYTEALSLAYLDQMVVEDLSLSLPDGQITVLVGANGSGKSTILKSLARILKPKGGAAYLDGKAIHSQPTKAIAQQLAILPQGPEAPEGLTVRELVAYGRFPYQHGFGVLSQEDKEIIHWALQATNMAEFGQRPVGALSGGQRQRAWIAMALAQDTSILLLDEPTTFLDMAYQLEVLQLLERLNQEAGRTVVMVLHDLNHAARYAHHLVAISKGKVVTQGRPVEVMTAAMLREVFAVEADIIIDPRSGMPLCIPYGLCTTEPADVTLSTSAA
jgi:iron complex transport system ATP-binding protein